MCDMLRKHFIEKRGFSFVIMPPSFSRENRHWPTVVAVWQIVAEHQWHEAVRNSTGKPALSNRRVQANTDQPVQWSGHYYLVQLDEDFFYEKNSTISWFCECLFHWLSMFSGLYKVLKVEMFIHFLRLMWEWVIWAAKTELKKNWTKFF